MSIELVHVAREYMENLNFTIRTGYLNDINNLRFGRANQLDGSIQACFQIDRIENVVNSADPINAYYTSPFVFFSSELQRILMNENDVQYRYGLSIIVHECVHYLQPFEGETPRAHNIGHAANLQIPFEYEAYLIMALFYFQEENIPNTPDDKNATIQRFLRQI